MVEPLRPAPRRGLLGPPAFVPARAVASPGRRPPLPAARRMAAVRVRPAELHRPGARRAGNEARLGGREPRVRSAGGVRGVGRETNRRRGKGVVGPIPPVGGEEGDGKGGRRGEGLSDPAGGRASEPAVPLPCADRGHGFGVKDWIFRSL